MNRATRITTLALSTLAGAGVLVPPTSASAAAGAIPATSAAPLPTGQIIFMQDPGTPGGQPSIAVAGADGTGLRTITPTGPGIQAGDAYSRPRISPDGKHLSFIASHQADTASRLVIADPDGSNATALPYEVDQGVYAWSADAAWIYIKELQKQGYELAAVRPDGTGYHLLVQDTPFSGLSVAAATGEVGFTTATPPSATVPYTIFSPDSGVTREVTLPEGAASESLSPDGRYVAVLDPGPAASTQIEIFPTDGSPGWVAQRGVAALDGYQPAWSPDESRLAFVTDVQVPGTSRFLPGVTIGSSSGNDPGRSLVPAFAPPASSTSAAWVPLPAGTAIEQPVPDARHGGPTVHRDAGPDRVRTGIAISQERWMTGSAKAVVLATSLNFPDALSGGPLAAKKQGPLLLTPGTAHGVDEGVLTEIRRVLPAGGTVYVLGGDNAINPGIAAQLKGLGYAVTQFKGTDRADTALQVAEDGMGSPRHVVVATGDGFADALAAGPYAAGPFADAPGSPAAIVLSDDAKLDPATAAFLAGKTVATVGAQAGKAWPTAARSFSGADRFATAAMVAGEFTGAHAGTQVGIANGVASAANPGYPDALTGGAFMAESDGPIVLIDGIHGVVPPASQQVLAARTGDVRADIFGGSGVISDQVAGTIVALLHGVAQF